MEHKPHRSGLGAIFAVLAEVSTRPRYAFLVLQLVAEIADGRGQAGPYVIAGDERILLRDWLCAQLLPISEQNRRRAALRARVAVALAPGLTGAPDEVARRVDQAVEQQVLQAGRANISRAISDLVRADLVTRHYAGYATDHANRGGGRHAVYVVKPAVLRLLRGPGTMPGGSIAPQPHQGELFAA